MIKEKVIKADEKVFVRLFPKAADSKGGAFGRPSQGAKCWTSKAQEGRQNNPVDCFVVGNPSEGFPTVPRFVPFANKDGLFRQPVRHSQF